MFWLTCLEFEKCSYSQLPGSLSPHYKYLHARQIPHLLSYPSQTIPDCIRYIMGVFAITLNHRQTFLLHINTLAYVKAEILSHAQDFTLVIHCVESLRRSNVYMFYS